MEGAWVGSAGPPLRAVRPQPAKKRRGPRPRSPRCGAGLFGAVFGPFGPVFFGGVRPLVGPPRRRVGGQPRAANQGVGRPPLGNANPKFSG